MSNRRIGAITFDLWDCVIVDDSDEAKRAALGLKPKDVARRELLQEALYTVEPVERAVTDLAFDTTTAAFNKVWREHHITWSVEERLRVMLTGLGRTLPDAALAALVRQQEDLELDPMPDPVPGVIEALRALHGQYKLAVISDTVWSPGTNLRKFLETYGVLDCFDHFVFSDELGHSKPHPAVFESVAEAFGVSVDSLVHIGDRPHNDIGGAHAVGARCVLSTVARQRDLEGHEPDAVCADYAELPGILAGME